MVRGSRINVHGFRTLAGLIFPNICFLEAGVSYHCRYVQLTTQFMFVSIDSCLEHNQSIHLHRSLNGSTTIKMLHTWQTNKACREGINNFHPVRRQMFISKELYALCSAVSQYFHCKIYLNPDKHRIPTVPKHCLRYQLAIHQNSAADARLHELICRN